MSMRFKGGVISATAPTTSTSAAKGVWTITQQMQAVNASTWPATPGAPTIGTATATGATTATVEFTPPTNLGAGTVTYTATSSPDGLTGTGSSSPVTVSGLTSGAAYTFTVTASTPGGASPASAASNSITTPLTIGQAFGGGFYAGQIDDSGTIYNLVVGPFSSAESGSKKWKITATTTAGADSDIDGPQNTADMVADGDATVYPAAHFCNDLTTGGFTDWYMPAKNELEVCYYNLKPTTAVNNTSSGINANAVPPRTSNYTSGDPAQTSAAAFITITGAEAFQEANYWASTELSGIPSNARRQAFSSGTQGGGGKDSAYRVRAVRRVPA